MNAAISREIGRFLTRNSKDGLFLRYARGRARGFLIGRTMTLIGAFIIAALSSFWLGTSADCLALIGEASDCTVIFYITRRFSGVVVPKAARVRGGSIRHDAGADHCHQRNDLLATDSAAGARFFAAAFLMSAAINAGLVRRHFALGASLPLMVYAATCLAMLLSDMRTDTHQMGAESWFLFISVLILAYPAWRDWMSRCLNCTVKMPPRNSAA